ncbi:hypothetical protein SALBM311S_05080 [Streptomyces alboniger]
MGLARSISSVAMAAMLRHSIAVGRTCVSPSDTTGRSSGMPPASYTPLRTEAATSFKCALQGVRSEAVLAMAICGRPVKASPGDTPAHPRPVDVGVAVLTRVPLVAS